MKERESVIDGRIIDTKKFPIIDRKVKEWFLENHEVGDNCKTWHKFNNKFYHRIYRGKDVGFINLVLQKQKELVDETNSLIKELNKEQ
ncbi:MAG: hypothetical protein U9O94_10660 [Nanoarchaeota archaeon]|nr:hypothetical protein [Nanoarchaeota archaeon]